MKITDVCGQIKTKLQTVFCSPKNSSNTALVYVEARSVLKFKLLQDKNMNTFLRNEYVNKLTLLFDNSFSKFIRLYI